MKRKYKKYTTLGLFEIQEYYKWIEKGTRDFIYNLRQAKKIRASSWDRSFSYFRVDQMRKIQAELKEISAEIILRKIINKKDHDNK